MKAAAAIAFALCVTSSPSKAGDWTTYRIAESGTSVDVPSSTFSQFAGKPDGYGQRFRRADGKADMTVQAVPREHGVSPAAFLARKDPPTGIVYKRVAPSFFVVSSIRRDKIWYDRCNFSTRFIHCVLINYPRSEKRAWDAIVTRISHSLSGG